MAKSGHVIYGPYDEFGEIWECEELDFCNGFYTEPEKSYAYATTTFWPYTIGCWGAAQGKLQFQPSCTSSACVAAASDLFSL